MSTYKGRVALVTGASSGIGAAIAEDLVKEGLIVVGAARRVENIQALAEKLKAQPGRLVPRKLDLSKSDEIEEIFKWIEKELGGVDVLINDAAVTNKKPTFEYTVEEIKFLTDVNQLAVFVATREAVNGMIRRNVNDGYIININSVLGHRVHYIPKSSRGLYPASKYAMTGFCHQLRHDLKDAGLKVRVTSVSPGAVFTEMTLPQRKAGVAMSFLTAQDVARTVTFVLSMPKSAEAEDPRVKDRKPLYGARIGRYLRPITATDSSDIGNKWLACRVNYYSRVSPV